MKARVLIVEDNEQNRLLLKDVLEFHGSEVLLAENGEQGVSLARAERPDLVLMDLQMPVMDGLTACKLLRNDQATRSLRLVAVTSFAMKRDHDRVMAAGFDAYVAKPIDTRRLPGVLDQVLGRRNSS